MKLTETTQQTIAKNYIYGVTTYASLAKRFGTSTYHVKKTLKLKKMRMHSGNQNIDKDIHMNRFSNTMYGHLIKDMSSVYNVPNRWLAKFDNMLKLRFIIKSFETRYKLEAHSKSTLDKQFFVDFVEHFYNNATFEKMYHNWHTVGNRANNMLKPTLELVNQTIATVNTVDNMRFVTRFENRAKIGMSNAEFDMIRKNLDMYLHGIKSKVVKVSDKKKIGLFGLLG